MDEANSLNLNEIRDAVQDCNINFLIGAGTSSPFLRLLGNVENLLFELSKQKLDEDKTNIIRASIYKYFFDACLSKNLEVLDSTKESGCQAPNKIDTLSLSKGSTI